MLERKENIIQNKTEDFSDRMVLLYQYLIEKKNEFIISKQIYRNGTSKTKAIFLYAEVQRSLILNS